jgi:hypothetical protein
VKPITQSNHRPALHAIRPPHLSALSIRLRFSSSIAVALKCANSANSCYPDSLITVFQRADSARRKEQPKGQFNDPPSAS